MSRDLLLTNDGAG